MKESLQKRAQEMGISLSERQLNQFVRYYELLVEWNEKMNLTAITEWDDVLSKHFLDSLSSAHLLHDRFGERFSLIDVGTGAGFPGIPLKIVFPEMRLLLLDSLQKRVGFLQTVCDELRFENVGCLHARAEEQAHKDGYRESFDVATARAVSALPVLAEYLSGYVIPGGICLAYKGPGWQEEYAAEESIFGRLQLRLSGSVPVEIPGTDLHHELVIFHKEAKLSLKYPRSQSKIKSRR